MSWALARGRLALFARCIFCQCIHAVFWSRDRAVPLVSAIVFSTPPTIVRSSVISRSRRRRHRMPMNAKLCGMASYGSLNGYLHPALGVRMILLYNSTRAVSDPAGPQVVSMPSIPFRANEELGRVETDRLTLFVLPFALFSSSSGLHGVSPCSSAALFSRFAPWGGSVSTLFKQRFVLPDSLESALVFFIRNGRCTSPPPTRI